MTLSYTYNKLSIAKWFLPTGVSGGRECRPVEEVEGEKPLRDWSTKVKAEQAKSCVHDGVGWKDT